MKQKVSKYSWRQYAKDSWMLLEGRRIRFTYYSFFIALSHFIPFAIAFLFGSIINFFVDFSFGESLRTFYLLSSSIAILGAAQVWIRFYGKKGLTTIGADIRQEVRVEVMSKLMDLELAWHDKEETGSKIQKINSGADSIYDSIGTFTNMMLPIAVGIIGGIISLILFDLKYFIFALGYALIYLSIEKYYNQRVAYWEDRLNTYKERVSGKMHESASNLLTIKSLGLKDTIKTSATNQERKFYQIWEQKRDAYQMKFKIAKSFSAFGYGAFIFFVGFDVVQGALSVGSIVIVVAYFDKLKGGLDNITNNSAQFIKIKSAVGRFMTIFGIEIFDRDSDKEAIPKHWKTLEFRNVTFKYKDKNILENFNFTIHRHEKVGVVGESGSGKSTLTKLILGLYHPLKGSILIDGVDIQGYRHSSLSEVFSVVLQESEIFNTSLINNVTISSKRKNTKLFEDVVNISQLDPVIGKLPSGVHSLLGEKGYHLSGGERQRIGIARALYKQSPFLILDEATSSLDSKTEALIQAGIQDNLREKTVLIVAHRLSTLKDVDRIIVMERGKVVEQGTYKELIRKGGPFFKLWKKQKMK